MWSWSKDIFFTSLQNISWIPLTDSPRRPLSRSRRQPNKASRRSSSNGKDLLRRRHVVCHGNLDSPVRRSQRLAGRRTPVGVSRIDGTTRPWCKCLGSANVFYLFIINFIVMNVTKTRNFLTFLSLWQSCHRSRKWIFWIKSQGKLN